MNLRGIYFANEAQSDVTGDRSFAVTIVTQALVEMVEAQSRIS